MAKPIKINLHQFVMKPKNDPYNRRKAFYGVMYKDGYQCATDTFTMIVIKDPYPPEYENKIINKKGKIMPFPVNNMIECITKATGLHKVPPQKNALFIDIEPILLWFKQNKGLKPARQNSLGPDDKVGMVKLKDQYFCATRLVPILKILKQLNINTVYISNHTLLVKNDFISIAVMSCPFDEEDINEHVLICKL